MGKCFISILYKNNLNEIFNSLQTNKSHQQYISGCNPGWYAPSEIVLLNDSVDKTMDYRLMFSEKEMKEFVAELSKYEVDYIDIAKAKKKLKKRKPCNCPEDDLFAELENGGETIAGNDSLTYVEKLTIKSGYANTKKIRMHLIKLHLTPIKYCKLCKEKSSRLKSMTLAEAQYRITGCPVSNGILNTVRIKDLKDKKKVPDSMLEELVAYYKKMKKELDKAEQFESNSETYYWVERKQLP